MTTALIVDDSSVDRELVRTLLTGGTGLDIQFADDGAVAIEQIKNHRPDIVVTDLNMPNVDGLRLVEMIHEEHSEIPVVLVTANGSEALAVQALRQGAASYVPKSSLAQDLVRTVMHVLAVARAEQSRREVRQCWLETKCAFEIPNDYNLIPPLVGQLAEIVEWMNLFDDTERIQLTLAVEEAISNALYHGNLELTTEQLSSVGYDLADPDSESIVDERRRQDPFKDRTIRVNAEITRQSVQFTIRDQGPGFAHSDLPSPEEVVASGELSGRGLAKIRLFCDAVRFNDQGNEIVLSKSVADRKV